MPTQEICYWNAWCDECDWRLRGFPDEEAALQALDEHIQKAHP